MGPNLPPPTDGERHHEIIAARRAAEARGGTPGGGYLISPDFVEPDPVLACIAAITPNAAGWATPMSDRPGVEVTRWACPGCGRLGWLSRHPDDPPCTGMCPTCQPDHDHDAP